MTEVDTAAADPAAQAALVEYATPHKRGPVERWAAPALAVVATQVAVLACLRGRATVLEAVSFVTGALCVWLTVRESVWNFPISLLNVATFSVVFFGARLFADASLQVVYFGLTLAGWYLWLYGGERRTALRVTRVGLRELALVILAGVLITVGLWRLLRLVGGSASFWDAITTAISLCAQWLLNRKRIANWFFWIAADVIYVPLYAYKALYLTSVLYGIFLVMCVLGLLHWRATLRSTTAETAATEAP